MSSGPGIDDRAVALAAGRWKTRTWCLRQRRCVLARDIPSLRRHAAVARVVASAATSFAPRVQDPGLRTSGETASTGGAAVLRRILGLRPPDSKRSGSLNVFAAANSAMSFSGGQARPLTVKRPSPTFQFPLCFFPFVSFMPFLAHCLPGGDCSRRADPRAVRRSGWATGFSSKLHGRQPKSAELQKPSSVARVVYSGM